MSHLTTIIRTATLHPSFRRALIRGLKAAASRTVSTKELPEHLRSALKEVGFNKATIDITPATTFSPSDGSAYGDGFKGYLVLINIGTGQKENFQGSWGGGNMFNRTVVDDDNHNHPIPPNHAVIIGNKGGGRPVSARIKIHPDNFGAMVIDGPKEELTPQEQKALNNIVGIKPGSRQDEFRRNGLGDYNLRNPLILRLIELKLLEVKGGKLFVTVEGKNRRTGVSW